MYVNERDQINYHGFLRALREMNQVSQECVSKGVCTVSGMNRFENGNRVAEKLMRDRLTARLGISGEKYEDYLRPKEYVRWEQRLRIVKAIEKKNYALAKSELMSYEELPGLNCVNNQFVEAMRFMILSLEGAAVEEQLECVEKAIKCTVPNVRKALEGEHLLSDQEINLVTEQIRLSTPKKVIRDVAAWRISEYTKLLAYIDGSCWEKLQKAKVYPKVANYVCKLLLERIPTEEECRRGLEFCHTAIELLRDSSRLYYFIELTELRRAFSERLISYGVEPLEKTKLEEMLHENNEWERVFKELYAEYKVAPYMSDFCYLYYETECHDMVEVIETRRKMLGLSRVKLGEGICTDRTIIRFEREGTNPSIDLVRLLFEKMGLCAEYRRARVITNDVETLMLAIEESKNTNNYEINLAEQNLEELKCRLNTRIPHNLQQIKRHEAILRFRKKKIGKKELYIELKNALETTLPMTALTKNVYYFTRSEFAGIYDLAFKFNQEESERCREIIQDICNLAYQKDIEAYMLYKHELLAGGLISYLGNIGKYDESKSMSLKMLEECLNYRRMVDIEINIYNIMWNSKQKREQEIDKQEELKQLENCHLISKIAKEHYREVFFQDKINAIVDYY